VGSNNPTWSISSNLVNYGITLKLDYVDYSDGRLLTENLILEGKI
jgi:hypothetical protein